MKSYFRLISLLALLAAALPASAYDFMVDGLCYNRNSNGTSVTVTSQKSSGYTSLSGALTIPPSVTYSGTTYSVTSIGDRAFTNCSGLTSVTIPNSVTSIGYTAFSGCSGLTSVTIPNSVTSIGQSAFSGCSGLTSVTIPNSVTHIGDDAFQNCSSLTSVTFPNSVTYIGEEAFEGTPWFNNQPDGLVYAGLMAYKYKGTMPDDTSIVIKDGTLEIASWCFYGCRGLTSVTIPNSVNVIGVAAFSCCSGLTSMTIPNSVTYIDESAFSGCSGLTSVTIPNSVTDILLDAFSGCSSLTSVTIPNSVTEIGFQVFEGCSGLTSVTIPNSVTSIGGRAFSGCSGLTSVTIPNSVTYIDHEAFSGCSGLTSVTIPNSVTDIHLEAFSGCSGLTDIYSDIENPSNVYLGENVFDGVNTSTCVLHVPAGTAALYRAAEQWNAFTIIVEPGPAYYLIGTASGVDVSEAFTNVNGVYTLRLDIMGSGQFQVVDENRVYYGGGRLTAASPSVTLERNSNDIEIYVPNGLFDWEYTFSIENGVLTVTHWPIMPTSVSINPVAKTLTVGEGFRLGLNILPENCNTIEYLSTEWNTSNAAVARVQNDGRVTAVAPGTATVSYSIRDDYDSYSPISGTCEVTVLPLSISAESISLDHSELSLTEGETATLTATVLPENATNKTVTWSSSDTSVATIENGVVTAVAAGTATITATTTDGSELSASCAVTVNPLIIIAESISLDRDEVTLTEGETATLTATVLPEDATDKGVTWSSSDTSVATVENGVVTAVAAGTATITATTADGTNLSASCAVTVNPLIIIAESISIDRNEVALSAGSIATLTATVLPEDATDKRLAWSSSNESVATVDANGTVTAVAAGTATITATTTDGSDLSASCAVTVIAQQLVNELSVADYRCMAGDTFTIDVSLSNGNEIGGVQFDLYLPEGFSVALDNDGKPDITLDENRSDGHQLMVNNDFADGHLNVLAFSMGNEAFVGNDGAVIHINVVADNALAGGDYVLELRDIELAVPDGSDAYNYASLTSTITVMMMGDANADGRVTVSDVLIVARRANGYVVDGLNDAIVDMNGDGRITVSDLLIVANISNNGQAAASGAPMRRAPRRANELSVDNHLAIADVTCDPGERFTLPVEMVNPDEIGGFMFDLYLPEGFSIGLNKKGKLDITLEEDRIEDHTLQFNNTFDDGHLHVQAFSMNNEPFYDNEGPVVYIAIVADDNVSAGIHTAAVRMIELSSPSGQENRQDDEGFTFNIIVAGEVTQTESITLDRNEVTLAEGETTTLTATVLPEDATDKGVSWSSSDESVATVDAAGTVTAVAAGTATITATTTDGSELSASCVVTVEAQQHSDGLSADNYLAIADVTCDPGERFTLPVEMVNPDEIGGFMFDLYLPEGFTIGLNKKGKLDITLEQDRIEDHMLQFNNSFDDGHLHVQAFSMSNEPFYGNEGPVVYIAIVADDNVSAGIHTAAVRMIELSSPSGMENRQDDEGFTFDINVAGGLTLAEVLSNGTDGSDYSISNTLAVVKKSEDNVHAYVTDGEGNWARLEGDAVAGLEEGAGVVGVAGTLSASGIAPTITLSAEPVLSTAVPYEIATIDLSRAFREMPMPCQVVTINGFFDGTKLRAYRAYPQGQGIAVDLGHSTADLEIGKKYIVTAAIELLEPWENDAPNGAPARIKTDDSNALDNLKAGILESQLDLETGIVDLAADDGDGVYYNLLGVPVQHPTQGIYIHNGKKVVVR